MSIKCLFDDCDVVREKASGQIFESSYCSTWGKLGLPSGHMIRGTERGREGKRGGTRGFARLGRHS